MAIINETGFVQKTQNQYFEEERQLYLDIDPNWNLDPSTPDGLKLASDSELYANLDEVLLQAYNSKDPNKARGVDLEIIGSITGSTKNPGTASTVGLLVGGVPGTSVTAGSRVSTSDNMFEWIIDNTVVIGGDGTMTANATSVELGAIQVDAGEITRILDTIGGWQSVTNPTATTPGQNKESDGQFRISRTNQVGRPGNNQLDSVRGEIGEVPNVRWFSVGDNDTDIVNPDGVPARHVYAIVDGGTDLDVAKAIYRKKNPGAPWFQAGTPVTVNVTSPLYPQNSTDIKFSRPIAVPMLVIINIIDDGTLIPGTVQKIKNSILDYAAGQLPSSENLFNLTGFGISDDVAVSRLYTPVQAIIGNLGNSYVSLLTINGLTTVVPIAYNELSEWTDINLTVTAT